MHLEIDSCPAVRFRDRIAANICDAGVATGATTFFRGRVVDPDLDAERDSCGQAVSVGSAVLATIRAAN